MCRRYWWTVGPILIWLTWFVLWPALAQGWSVPNALVTLPLLYISGSALAGIDIWAVRLFYWNDDRIRTKARNCLTPDDYFRLARTAKWPWAALCEALEDKGIRMYLGNLDSSFREQRSEIGINAVRSYHVSTIEQSVWPADIRAKIVRRINHSARSHRQLMIQEWQAQDTP